MSDQSARFREDILAEPATLSALLETYADRDSPLDGRSFDPERVVFIGMGSSRFAALPAAALLRSRGIDAAVEYASTGAPTPPARGTLAVFVSASGKTPETVEAGRRHSGMSTVVQVTNDVAWDLDESLVLPVHAGEEAGGIACRSFQCTVAVLLLLCGRILGEPTDLRPAVSACEHLIATRESWVGPALGILGGGPIYTVAPAERLSSAQQSALMFREAPRIPADACETGDWLHVDVYLTRSPGYRALLFPGSRFDGAFMDWVERREGTVVAVGSPVPGAALQIAYPGSDDPLVPLLVETTVAELLAAEMWARSAAG